MGFFQELKDNLSIAVSELIPDDDVLIKGIKKEEQQESLEEQKTVDELLDLDKEIVDVDAILRIPWNNFSIPNLIK